jgi:hypothetical protein
MTLDIMTQFCQIYFLINVVMLRVILPSVTMFIILIKVDMLNAIR